MDCEKVLKLIAKKCEGTLIISEKSAKFKYCGQYDELRTEIELADRLYDECFLSGEFKGKKKAVDEINKFASML